MKELELAPLVDIAIDIDGDVKTLDRQEMEIAAIERGIRSPVPARLKERCRDLVLASIAIRGIFSTGPATAASLKRRQETRDDHPEVAALVAALLRQTRDNGERAVRLKRRANDVELLALSAIKDLEDQSVDSRILRLLAGDDRRLGADEIRLVLQADQDAITDARDAWRLMHSPGPIISIGRSIPAGDVVPALRRLERTGHALRYHSLLGGTRWSFPSAAENRQAA